MTETKTTPKPVERSRFGNWFHKKSFFVKTLLILFSSLFLLFAFTERILLSPVFIALYRFGPIILLVLLFFYGIYKFLFKKKKALGKFVIIAVLVGFIGLCIWLRLSPLGLYNYLSSYHRFNTLEKVYLPTIPETDNEVMQSHISIKTIAEQELSETEKVSDPFIIRDSNDYRYVLVKEPSYSLQQLVRSVNTIYSIPALESSLEFSGKNQAEVDFAIGETLLLGSNTHTATLRALSFLDFFHTELGKPRFMKDDEGQLVQVIPLIKWYSTGLFGIFFPQPEFGGVHVIKDGEGHASDMKKFLKRSFFGVGETYSISEMKKFRFLQNQNLMPTKVSMSVAKSFRFQNGFTAPLPMNHYGDVRIPHLDDGIGELPITAFFKMSAVSGNAKDMLYEYIPLEPYDSSKHGLVLSVYLPSDGGMTVYIHRHTNDVYPGISTVAGKARESKQQVDWTQTKVADVRPFNKKLFGEVRPFWLFSLVTKAQSSHGFASSKNASMGLVDPTNQNVLWLNPEERDKWEEQLQEMLTPK